MEANEKIARWFGTDKCSYKLCPFRSDECVPIPSYDTNITLWHGRGRLLDAIRADEKVYAAFLGAIGAPGDVRCLSYYDGVACGLTRTPAQLAAALVKAIEEVEVANQGI